MVARLEALPKFADVRDEMNLLGLIDLIRAITHSFEGSTNVCDALIDMKKQQVNVRQGDKSNED